MFKTAGLLIIVIFLALLFSVENLNAQTPAPSPSLTPTPTPEFIFSTDPTSWIIELPLNRRRRNQPVVINQPANVVALHLDKTEFVLSDGFLTVNVSTQASDADDDIIVYEYTVSSGKIEGQGANVKWDLSGVAPGTYTITAGADDGCGVCGKTLTMSVTVVSHSITEAELEKVDLDDTMATLLCPVTPNREDGNCSKKSQRIIVTSYVKNIEKGDFDYYYIVTGGEVIGKGKQVAWDFNGVRPGKYEITVGIGKDKIISGKTITKTIELKECDPCDPPKCECPIVSISGPAGPVKAGGSIMFEAKVSGGDRYGPLKYKWTISRGIILSGEGKSHILIKTKPDMSGEITVTVEIGGICTDCPNKDSKTILLSAKKKSN